MQFIDPQTYYNNLAKKPIGVGVLLFNKQGEILVVKPSYKKDWSLPGGAVEKDESLKTTLLREIKEEINLDTVNNLKIAVVDYQQASRINGISRADNLQIIFNGGVLDDNDLKNIQIDNEEIIEYKFLPPEKALEILSEKLKKRISVYLRRKEAVYLENGSEGI